jgi:hypothetical protein
MTGKSAILHRDKLLAANKDLLNSIALRGLTLVYDEVLDTLFLEIGGPRKASNETLIDTIMLRVDPTNLEIVACEITEFFSDFVPEHRLVATLVDDLGIQENEEFRLLLPARQAKGVGQLIIAVLSAFAHVK